MARGASRSRTATPHPDALLREDVIPSTGKTKTEIAQLLGISRQHLYDILRERKPVSPAVAVRLGKLFGDGAGVWVRMQAAYDTWHAEREEEVSGIPTLHPHKHHGRDAPTATPGMMGAYLAGTWCLPRIRRYNIVQDRRVARHGR
jgi:antitoxin HigA-1